MWNTLFFNMMQIALPLCFLLRDFSCVISIASCIPDEGLKESQASDFEAE